MPIPALSIWTKWSMDHYKLFGIENFCYFSCLLFTILCFLLNNFLENCVRPIIKTKNKSWKLRIFFCLYQSFVTPAGYNKNDWCGPSGAALYFTLIQTDTLCTLVQMLSLKSIHQYFRFLKKGFQCRDFQEFWNSWIE